MQSTDPIADMLSRIRNAAAVNQAEVSLPYSKLKEQVAKLLADNGYLVKVSVDGDGKTKQLNLQLSDGSANSVISSMRRLSRPGRRLYVSADQVPVVKRGRGLVIVSTSSGLMTGSQAREKHLGGELICEVY